MAVLDATKLTLADWAKRLDPDGSVADIAEMLSQTNAILKDAVYKPGNEPTSHRVTIRTGLPTVYYRALNAGVPNSKSTTAQVVEGMAMLEARSLIDMKELKLNGNSAEFMMSESRPFLEAMNQTQAYGMLYGNPAVDPKQYLGLATRYSSLSAGNAQNIIDAGGAGSDNTSVYLVVWGNETVFCTFPPGSQAGLQTKPLGEQPVPDAAGNRYQAMETVFQWDNGMVVKDWRYVVRIANIDVSNLVGESSAADLVKLLTRAIFRIPNMGMGTAALYMNRTAMSALAIQGLNFNKTAVTVQAALDEFGKPMPGRNEFAFLGIPIRQVDQITLAETRVT